MNPVANGWRSILVHAGVDAGASSRLRAALTFGARFSAHVTGVGAFGFDPYADTGLRKEVEDSLAVAETAFRIGVARYAHPTHYRALPAPPAQAMARLCCGADLVVASPGIDQRDDRWFPPVADLVMGCGTPVLLAPRDKDELQPRCVAIGWKNTRETRRAITDALPLLRIAERVHLVSVLEAEGAAAPIGEMDHVVQRLAAHGVTADAASWPLLGPSVAEELMTWSECHHADTLLVGAYGHSRRREWMLGGVTADLVRQERMRVLFGR